MNKNKQKYSKKFYTVVSSDDIIETVDEFLSDIEMSNIYASKEEAIKEFEDNYAFNYIFEISLTGAWVDRNPVKRVLDLIEVEIN